MSVEVIELCHAVSENTAKTVGLAVSAVSWSVFPQ